MPVSRLPVSLKSLARLLRSSEISSYALAVTSVNAASASLHGCFSEIHQDIALRAARAADKRFADGTSLGWLDGIPFAIKDNFCTEFGSTTARCMFEHGIILLRSHQPSCSSLVLSDFKPCFNATAVQRLLDNGAIPIGKTVMDEFGMGSFTLNREGGSTM